MYSIAFLDDMITWVFPFLPEMQKTLRMQMFVQDLPEDNGSLLYNFLHPVGEFMMKVMVWCFVSDCLWDTHEVMTALILVKSVLVLELTKGLRLKHCHGVLCHLFYDKSKIFWIRCLCSLWSKGAGCCRLKRRFTSDEVLQLLDRCYNLDHMVRSRALAIVPTGLNAWFWTLAHLISSWTILFPLSLHLSPFISLGPSKLVARSMVIKQQAGSSLSLVKACFVMCFSISELLWWMADSGS